ncbi:MULTISPECIES: hypothetical protein [Azorhizobium]|uniref:hypothetical protein n=1 Tax=Azorhizobium TaxID=6 RepID=UPI0010E86B8C|nr:hypothetical protein [Azorhizobium sp. AG788]TDT99590.1 hypothetical protein DFO45_1300 [Azorhizobium sp. AG788]
MTTRQNPSALPLDAIDLAFARHGGELALWPAEVRGQMEAACAADPAFRAAFEDARRFDANLRAALGGDLTPADMALGGKVAARLAVMPLPEQRVSLARRVVGWLAAVDLRPAWPGVAALTGMALLGFVLGANLTDLGLSYGLGATRANAADVSALLFEPDPITENGF